MTDFDDQSWREYNLTQMANDETTMSSVLYGRPGMIRNAELLLNQAAKSSCGNSGHLKPDLTLHFDYVTVTKEVWTHLYSWYSADYVIFRSLKRQENHLAGPSAKLVLDLYPKRS